MRGANAGPDDWTKGAYFGNTRPMSSTKLSCVPDTDDRSAQTASHRPGGQEGGAVSNPNYVGF